MPPGCLLERSYYEKTRRNPVKCKRSFSSIRFGQNLPGHQDIENHEFQIEFPLVWWKTAWLRWDVTANDVEAALKGLPHVMMSSLRDIN